MSPCFEPDHIGTLLLQPMAHGLSIIAGSSPLAHSFAHCASELSNEVLVRHLIEHVFRIRMFRPFDVAATKWLADHVPEAESEWASYARSEAVHDRYFLRDLKEIGLDRFEVELYKPFEATIALKEYMHRAMEHFGALPAVLYSFWTERNSDVGSKAVIARSVEAFGAGAMRGVSAHLALDEQRAHVEVVDRVLAQLVKDEHSFMLAVGILDGVTYWIGQYFLELDRWRQAMRNSGRQAIVMSAH